jgi:ribonuclease HI
MELNAACSGLRALPNDEPVTVYTDSMYVIWAAKNRDSWAKKHAKGKLTNADLWLLLQSLLKQRKAATEWQWVRGHNGDYYNEMADGLAEQAARQ